MTSSLKRQHESLNSATAKLSLNIAEHTDFGHKTSDKRPLVGAAVRQGVHGTVSLTSDRGSVAPRATLSRRTMQDLRDGLSRVVILRFGFIKRAT
jgi:hypothetical protein